MDVNHSSTWHEFALAAPDLAAFGGARFGSRVAYLATVRADGSPRVHPFTPLLLEGSMFCFMRKTSPKGRDLRRDPRFAVHCSVENEDGGHGEFYVRGSARLVEDDSHLHSLVASKAGYDVLPDDILFELRISEARSVVYGDGGGLLEWHAE